MLYYGLEQHSLDSYFQFKELGSAPSTPTTNEIRLYAKDNGSGVSTLCYKNDAGTEICFPTSGSFVTGTGTDNQVAIWNGTSAIDAFNATAGSVFFAGAGGILAQDNSNFFWDNTSKLLGIGNNSPAFAIEIRGGTNALANIVTKEASADTTSPGVALLKARGTLGSEAATQSGDGIGNLSFGGWTNAYKFNAARIEGFAGSLWTATNAESYLTLATTPSGSLTRSERFRIGSAGQWGIGGATFGTALDVFTSGGASAAPTWTSPGALTKVDDTNVTLTLGGTPATALLRAASLTLGWTGQLAVSRGGTGLSSISGDWLSQYALLAGRSGGQILKGGTAAADSLTLTATSGVGAGSEAIIFQVGNNGATEGMRIRGGSTGRIGIGTSSPKHLLHISFNNTVGTRALGLEGDGTAANCSFETYVDSTAASTFIMRKGRGTVASPTQTLSGDSLGTFVSRAIDNTPAITGDMAKFDFIATENITTTAHGSRILFTTVANGSTVQVANVMMPEDGGIALVDGITAPATLTGWAKIYVDTADGGLKVKFGNGTVKTIATNP